MLHFARPKAAHFQEEDINEVIEKSLAILQAKFRKGNIALAFEKGEELPRLRIDIHQIQQVLINLMLNAIQAMEKGRNPNPPHLPGERGRSRGGSPGYRRRDSAGTT